MGRAPSWQPLKATRLIRLSNCGRHCGVLWSRIGSEENRKRRHFSTQAIPARARTAQLLLTAFVGETLCFWAFETLTTPRTFTMRLNHGAQPLAAARRA